jgi:hypothetical protein
MKKLGTIAIGYQVGYCIAFAFVHITLPGSLYSFFLFLSLSRRCLFPKIENADAENK